MLPLIITTLLSKGISLLGNAALAKGTDWVKDKTGVDLNKPELSNEDLVTLKKYEMDHEEELLKLQLEDNKLQAAMDEMYLKDTQSARVMQTSALEQDDIFSKRFIYYLAIFWSVMATIYIGCITFLDIPASNVRFADTILGFLLGTIVAQIIQFFFGSSRSSQHKDKLLHAMKEKGGV
jgi:hypothetical protein